MIKLLIAVLLLSHVAVAQSGTLTMSSAPTNSTYVIQPPPPTGGQTRLQVTAEGSFSQGLTVWNNFPVPVAANLTFCNELRLSAGDLVLASDMRRTRVDLVCGGSTTCGYTTRSVYTAGFTASLNVLPDRTFTLSNLVRSRVAMDFPFGDGTLIHGTQSFAANVVNWTYVP